MSDKFNVNELTKRMMGAIDTFHKDLGGLRTGRASPSLVDSISVNAYGGKSPLNQIANVNTPEPKLITVQIWDKSLVAAAEKAIRDAGLGLNPVVDGQNLRIPLPDLNEERRKELVKIAKEYGENAKVAVRHVRRDGMEMLKNLEKNKEIGKDEAFKDSETLQKLTDEKVAEIDKVLDDKETEIMQV